jgi:hypothetical protein
MTVEEILQALGYTHEWLEWGIVDEEYLRSQYAKYSQSDDKNQEHYRCQGFLDYLNLLQQVTDEMIDRIFLLTDAGPDGCDLTVNRLFELIGSGILTDEQHFALAHRHPGVLEKPIEEFYRRHSLLRKVRQSGLAANFTEIQESADSFIQLHLLDHPDVAREHLEWLKDAGASKSIRNRAEACLRSKKFRTT